MVGSEEGAGAAGDAALEQGHAEQLRGHASRAIAYIIIIIILLL